MKKLNIKALMLMFCACTFQNISAQVVRVYTNDGAVREISSVEKVKFHDTQALGKSLYQELQKRKTYTTTLRLIDDLGYTEILSAKGSFTLYAAPDAAYAEFFKNNPWGVASYEELTKTQKLQLLKISMLNEAYSLNAITTTDDGADLACLRRNALISETDYVVPFAPNELPSSTEAGTDAFKLLRDKGTTTYLSTTGASPMLNQFYADVLKHYKIPTSDIELLMGRKWNTTGQKAIGILNDCRIIEGGITCSNGYLNILDKVLFPVNSMAEIIRTNANTRLFNILLERFAAPFYNAEVTAQYNLEYQASVDSVYEMGFINLPANANFYNTTQRDIPTMFVPCDEAVANYFVNGNGAIFIDEYCQRPNTKENLSQNLKDLPISIASQILENLMGHNFTQTTPSQFRSICDVDMNELFPGYATTDEYFTTVVKQCLHANNGIVYITKIWPSITELASVIAPIKNSADTKIFNAIVTADDNYIQGSSYSNAPLKQYFSTYFKAMPNHFSVFVPTDDALGTYGYIDPVSYSKLPYGKKMNNIRFYWRFVYDGNTPGAIIPIESVAYRYDQKKGQQIPDETGRGGDKKHGSKYISASTDQLSGNNYGITKRELLIEMTNQHFIIHESDKEMGSNRKFFMSRSGAPVYVASAGDHSNSGVGLGVGATVKGGFQLMLDGDEYAENDHAATVMRSYDFTETTNGSGNGMTYIIDRPLQPTMRSVCNVMTVEEDYAGPNPFSEFYELANPSYISEDLLKAIGFIDEEHASNNEQQQQKLKYHIFVRREDNPMSARSYCPASNESLVRFFNNYNYTIYIPTNDQVHEARNNGLMTWQEIDDWVRSKTMDNDASNDTDFGYEVPLSETDRIKAQAMVTTLVNFVKYHFQDHSLFLDDVNSENTYMTSCYNNTSYNYLRLNVKQSPSQITITDAMGNQANVVSEEGKCNILARDINYNGQSTEDVRYVKNSSYVVLHQIDKYLNFNSEADYEAYPNCPKGRFDIWNYIEDSTSKTKALKSYVAKYQPLL
ncbi:MAG: hypothetical protein II200_02145 [Bacteroidaceae bacterium]|nr:hypothetical protein [Bacteroidaceae bacterium]